MKTKIFYIMITMLLFAAFANAAYDVVAVDTGNSEITRMDVEGNIVWQTGLGNAYVDLAVGPDNNIYVADNTNRRVTFVGAWSGESYTYYEDGSRCIAVAFGTDYNGDGTSDLFVAGEGRVAVVGGPGNGNAGDLLATTSALIGANDVSLVFGPDETADGNEELYVVDGDANVISVVDGMDITNVIRTFPVNISQLKGGVIKDGKLYYSDTNTSTRNFVAYYNIDGSGAPDVNRVLEHPTVNYAQFFDIAPDGLVYMPNRFETGTRTNPSVDVFDSSWNYVETIYEKAGANFTAVGFIPVEDTYKEFYVVDGVISEKLYKYNHFGELEWEAEGYRSVNTIKEGPDGNLYGFKNGSPETVIDMYDPKDGSNIKHFYNPDTRCYDGDFAYDYNGDGVLDLYALVGDVDWSWDGNVCTVTSYSSLKVLSGPGADDEGTELASLDNLIAGAITKGPDVATVAAASEPNSPDGIDELYLGFAGNGSTSAHGMYVIEPSTLRIVEAYTQQRDASVPDWDSNPAMRFSGLNELQFGPDGFLYANSHYTDRFARYEIVVDAGDVSIVSNGVGSDYFFVDDTMANNPSGFDFYDNKLYSANRLQPGSNTYPGTVTMINGDTSYAGLFVNMPGSDTRANDVLILDAEGCPVDYPADLNGDCVVDAADIAVIAQDWLECTDPDPANCP